jgi:hypothetical protein
MMLLTSLINILALNFFSHKILKKIDSKFNETSDRDELQRKWLFDALYSINQNVKLPNEEIIPMMRKAKVYNPQLDPMKEFEQMPDDWLIHD